MGRDLDGSEETNTTLSESAPSRAGVRVYLFVLFALVAFVPLIVLGAIQGRRMAHEAVAGADRETLAAATAVSRQLSIAMTGYVRAAESLAAQFSARAASLDLEEEDIQGLLEAHTLPHPEFLGVYVARANGLSVAHYSGTLRRFEPSAIDYRGRDYYRELMRTRRTAISRVQVGRVTRSPDVQIAAPIFDEKQRIIGFVCSSVDLNKVSELVRETAKSLERGRILVLDEERRVIGDSTRDHVDLVDLSGVALYAGNAEPRAGEGLDDHGTLARVAVVPAETVGRSWTVVASIPTRVVNLHEAQALQLTLLFALAALGLALILAALFSLSLSAPLRALARTAASIRRGDSHELPEIPKRAPRELLQVVIAVRSMIVALRRYAEKLQTLVDERTRELTQANLQLGVTLNELEANQRIIDADLARARQFQERFLPVLQSTQRVDLASHFRPLEQVGGDIFDVCEPRPNVTRVFVADATGHGVQASMRTIVIKFEYDRLKREHESPRELLQKLNERLIRLFPEGELHCAAMVADLVLRERSAELRWCNAGCPPILAISTEGLEELYAPGPLLGVVPTQFDPPATRTLLGGTTLIFSTDGIFEQMGPNRQRFDGVISAERLCSSKGAQGRLQEIVRQFEGFLAGRRPNDDVTLVALHWSD